MPPFKLHSEFSPTGDQPTAIAALTEGVEAGRPHQVLLGVTGSGKTFTMAQVIAKVQRPALILAHNKTLAAQLYHEFKCFFPENAVEYFVSYYDYYQPEAYVPSSDTYIDKEATINDDIDRLRMSATRSLFERNDVIIVATVSCIYGLGSAEAYYDMMVFLDRQSRADRDKVLRKLVDIRYERNEADFHRGTFRVRGDNVEVFPAYEEDRAIRIRFFDDEVEAIQEIDPLRGVVLRELDKIAIYPATHHVTTEQTTARAMMTIRAELKDRLKYLESENKLLEAQRLGQRTNFDLEMMGQVGYCQGIENYSRHFTGRAPGEPPPTLLDYFPKGRWLLFVDESHATLPQLGGMYRGDRARKETLVNYGFRLPSALDNRPLRFEEFEQRIHQAIHVSATPGDYELQKSGGLVVEQLIRPTGLVDPEIDVRPAQGQVDDLLDEIRLRTTVGERVLVTTLTKRMAEELTDYYNELGIKVRYLHADIETLERTSILRDLRLGVFDVLIGINLLREGLDLPEVSLVAILDADKEGFLRATRSLIQTIGRAARNAHGKVILYADKMTKSMEAAIRETERRREVQRAYNEAHGIVPTTIIKPITDMAVYGVPESIRDPRFAEPAPGEASPGTGGGRKRKGAKGTAASGTSPTPLTPATLPASADEFDKYLHSLETAMARAAADLNFEEAARIRDEIKGLRQLRLFTGWGVGE